MMSMLQLSNGILAASVSPELGASLARLDHVAGGEPQPLLRPAPEGATSAFELACQILAPWSNRVSSGGFSFAGRRYDLPLNVDRGPFPNHGNAFSLAWEVVEAGPAIALLRVRSQGPGSFIYSGEIRYSIDKGALTAELAIRNDGGESLPFGIGLHPWFVRTVATELYAPAKAVWLEDERHLPAGGEPVPIPSHWNFSSASTLPPAFINNGFVGWNGHAKVRWPDRNLELEISASPTFGMYMLYSPSEASDFFCFEPVSHAVDAFNLPGGPQAHGMVVLAPGEVLGGVVRFTVQETERGGRN